MAVTIKMDNYSSSNVVERTQLDADALAAQAALTLISSQNIAVDNFCIVGQPGTEQSELKKVLTVNANGTGITLTTNLAYAHSRFKQFITLFGNQLKVYRAANVDGSQPADGSFSNIATVDIDPDQLYTSYTDSTGSSSYWYKFNYYNSVSLAESNLADATAARGGGVNNYASIDDIRDKAGLTNNQNITDSTINLERLAAQAEIDATLAGIYVIPFTAPINPLIEQVTILLTAGRLLLKDYGPLTKIDTAEGNNMIADGRELLQRLNTKKLVLTNVAGVDTSTAGAAGGYSGWPNADTENAEVTDGGAARQFRMSDRY